MSNNLIIRKATKEDAKTILICMLLAMEDIVCKFLNTKNKQQAADFLFHFIRLKNNMYSWQNCRVMEKNGKIMAAANVYAGADLIRLRQPVTDYIRSHYNPDYYHEDETQSGEFYIDSLGVLPEEQGKGIGSALLRFLIEEYVHSQNKVLGLLVDEMNPKAKKLYLKLGFKVVNEQMLAGKKMEHLQMKPAE